MSKEGDIVAAVHNLMVEIITVKNSNSVLQPWLEQVLKRWDEDRGKDTFENYKRIKEE